MRYQAGKETCNVVLECFSLLEGGQSHGTNSAGDGSASKEIFISFFCLSHSFLMFVFYLMPSCLWNIYHVIYFLFILWFFCFLFRIAQ